MVTEGPDPRGVLRAGAGPGAGIGGAYVSDNVPPGGGGGGYATAGTAGGCGTSGAFSIVEKERHRVHRFNAVPFTFTEAVCFLILM